MSDEVGSVEFETRHAVIELLAEVFLHGNQCGAADHCRAQIRELAFMSASVMLLQLVWFGFSDVGMVALQLLFAGLSLLRWFEYRHCQASAAAQMEIVRELIRDWK